MLRDTTTATVPEVAVVTDAPPGLPGTAGVTFTHLFDDPMAVLLPARTITPGRLRLGDGPGGEGEAQREGAPSVDVFVGQVASHTPGEAPRHRQSQPDRALLGPAVDAPLIRLEEDGGDVGRYRSSVVADDEGGPGVADLEPHQDGGFGMPDGVHQDVADDLAHPERVALDERQDDHVRRHVHDRVSLQPSRHEELARHQGQIDPRAGEQPGV